MKRIHLDYYADVYAVSEAEERICLMSGTNVVLPRVK